MKLLARLTAQSLPFFACALLGHAQPAAPRPRQGARPSPPALRLGKWKEFAPAGGGFSILFPGSPKSMTRTLRLSPQHTAELRVHTLSNPTLECSVIYADYPTIPVGDPAAARAALDSGAKGAVASVNAELLSLTEITHEGYPGRLLRERMPDGKILRAKMVLVSQRLFQVAFTTPREDGASAQTVRHYEQTADRFLNSFKLDHAPLYGRVLPDDAVAVTLDAAQPGEVDQYLADHPRQVLGRRAEGGNDLLTHADQARIVQGAVVSKPPPPYPAIARATRASGEVAVWVVVDEEGKVVAAQAASGHPLLRASAVKAAREARFAPTLLDGKPVKVAGLITYNFELR